jgi:uncharacterized delta-60 repeat protein
MTARRVSRAVLLGFVLCFFAATPLAAQAAAGDLDASFGTDGLVTTTFDPTNIGGAYGVAVQGDGKIVAVGQCTNLCLARYNDDGTLDSSFGTDGKVTTSPTVSYVPVGVALQSDGKIVVAGTCSDGQTIQGICVTRYSASGSLEANTLTKVVLNAGSATFANAGSMALQGDGKIVVGGYCSIPGTAALCLARYNTDLSLDTSFGGGEFNGYGCLLSTSPGVCDYSIRPERWPPSSAAGRSTRSTSPVVSSSRVMGRSSLGRPASTDPAALPSASPASPPTVPLRAP